MPFSYKRGKSRLTPAPGKLFRVRCISEEVIMKTDRQPRQGTSIPRPARPQSDSKPANTPNADMRAEDAGTQKSGADSATAASRVMKQTSKTDAETKR